MRSATLILLSVVGLAAPGRAQETLPAAEVSAAFEAAGFSLVEGQWQSCGDPGTASYQPGAVAEVRDLDGDGQPEAVITEGSIFCFGGTEVGYALVSRQPDGEWRLVTQGAGMPRVLTTKGQDGWPDLEIGGPGFCFPVVRWNGREYALDRHQYDGRPCRPGG